MKKQCVVATLSLSLLSANVYADVCSTYAHRYENHFDGPTQCGTGTLSDSTTIAGPLTLDGTTISSSLIADGPLTATHITVASGTLMAHGVSKVNDSTLQSSRFYGPLLATNSTLGNDITIYSNVAFLNQSTAGDLTIKDDDDEPRTTPHLHVDNHSTIKGDITFIGNPGIVFIDSTSTLQGKIINGSKATESTQDGTADMQRVSDETDHYRHHDDDEDDDDNDNGNYHHHHWNHDDDEDEDE